MYMHSTYKYYVLTILYDKYIGKCPWDQALVPHGQITQVPTLLLRV